MQKRDVATLAFKVSALYVAFGAATSLEALLNEWSAIRDTGTNLADMLPFFLSAAIALGIGFLIWTSADQIARRVFPENEETVPTGSPRSVADVMVISISIVGLWLVVQAGPGLIYWIAAYGFSSAGSYRSAMGAGVPLTEHEMEAVFDIRTKATMISELIKLLVGIVCLMAPKGIYSRLDAIRTRFAPSATATDDDQQEQGTSQE